MSADGAAASAGVARLAGPLRRLASRAGDAADPQDLWPVVAPLRAFVEHPSPAKYLAATRALRAAQRQQKLARLAAVAAPRRAPEHLRAVVEATGLPAELHDLLSRLPTDARTSRRFAIIAELLTAHRLLSTVAEAAQQDLQEHLGQPAARASSVARRRRR